MKTDKLNSNHLIVNEGKVLRRISDKWIAGTEIYLGYTYYLNGEQLTEPLLELPEHYEEVDEILFEEVPDESFDVVVEPEVIAILSDEALPTEAISEPAERPTLATLLSRALTRIDSLEKEVSDLKKGSHLIKM